MYSLALLQQYLPLAVLKLELYRKGNTAYVMLQQYLPLAVLKLIYKLWMRCPLNDVATVPTACGIETSENPSTCGGFIKVATVPTACGIETPLKYNPDSTGNKSLQQYLPLAVLKQSPHHSS